MTHFSYRYIRLPDREFTFEADLLEASTRRIILAAPLFPSAPIRIEGETVLDRGYEAVWFLWKGAAYDLARVYRSDGVFTGYYADALEPVYWEGTDPQTLEPIVDLFLDIWITPEGRTTVLDEDELEAAVGSGVLSPARAGAARATIKRLQGAVVDGTFPPPEVRAYARTSPYQQP